MTRFHLFTVLLVACAPTLEEDGAQKDGLGASVSFQNGVNGYSGTRDVSISTQYGGNGVTTTDGELMSWKISGTSGYEERALIRFDALSLPAKPEMAKLPLSSPPGVLQLAPSSRPTQPSAADAGFHVELM